MRVRLIKEYKNYQLGQIITVAKKTGELLIKSGIAIYSKDMTNHDLKVK